jgi:hypothetical protein
MPVNYDKKLIKTVTISFGSSFGQTLKQKHDQIFVAFKMGRRQGGPGRTGAEGRISESIRYR